MIVSYTGLTDTKNKFVCSNSQKQNIPKYSDIVSKHVLYFSFFLTLHAWKIVIILYICKIMID